MDKKILIGLFAFAIILFVAALAAFRDSPVSIVSPLAVYTYPTTAGIGVGDTFQHTFTLTNREASSLPESDYSDGKVTNLFWSYRVTDPTGAKKKEITTEVTATMPTGGTIPLPVSYDVTETAISGKYGVVAILFKVERTWDVASKTWVQANPVIVDGPQQSSVLAVSFTANTPNQPGAFSIDSITAAIGGLFSGIFSFIAGLFGWV